MSDSPIEIPASYTGLEADEVAYPDIPTTEVIHPQRRVARAEGEAYTTIEYIEVHQGLPVGPAGAVGPTGPAGEDGGKWLVGSEDPNTLYPTGPDGPNDMFIDSVTGEVWYWNEAAGEWVPSGNSFILPTGPTGPQGAQGIQGPTGPTGPQGGGIHVHGTFENYPNCNTQPPFDGQEVGDGYIDSCGNLWGWIDVDGVQQWYNFGEHMGPTGPAGPGAQWLEIPFAFQLEPDQVYAKMAVAIPVDFIHKRPTVTVMIDFKGDGRFSTTGVVQVTYLPTDAIEIIAERSIMTYNGTRGLVVLK